MNRFLFLSLALIVGLCSFSVAPGKLQPEKKIVLKLADEDIPQAGDNALSWLSSSRSSSGGSASDRTEEENKMIAEKSDNGRLCFFFYSPEKENLCRLLVVYDCSTYQIVVVVSMP